MAGENTSISNGKAIATTIAATPALRGILTSADENSTTGNSVIIEIAQSDSMRTLNIRAIKTASANGAAKMTTTKRRVGSDGHTVSAKAARPGRAATRLNTSGTAI